MSDTKNIEITREEADLLVTAIREMQDKYVGLQDSHDNVIRTHAHKRHQDLYDVWEKIQKPFIS